MVMTMDYEQKYKAALEWMQGMYGGLHGKTKEEAEKYFPELAESEDERIEKEIIAFLKENLETGRAEETWSLSGLKRWIAWLEKQGEQKYIPKYKIGDYVKNTNYKGEPIYEIIYMDKECYICEYRGKEKMGDKAVMHFSFDNPYLRLAQKPADKVEPKFHESEWITNGDYTWKIVEVKPLDYILQSQDGNIVDDTISHVDEQFHSFTIEDAKDGDILVNGSNIFIFSHLSDTRAMGYCHINLDDGRFYDDKGKNECFGLIDTVFTPATKEQRDLLFAKMKEAGFEWNAEKKELKMLENQGKSMWTEEDEKRLQSCISELQGKGLMGGVDTMDSKWLKSLKQRMEEQQWQRK